MTLSDKIFQHIEAYHAREGHAPTKSEIARDLNTTRQAVHYHFLKFADSLKKYPEYARYVNNKKKVPQHDTAVA